MIIKDSLETLFIQSSGSDDKEVIKNKARLQMKEMKKEENE